MLGVNGWISAADIGLGQACAAILVLSGIALFAPNTQEILPGMREAGATPKIGWKPSLVWAVAMGCVFGVAVGGMIEKPTEFLYFRF